MSIVAIGSVFVDIKGYPLSTYIPAGRNEGRVEIVHGGVCRNIAENIANLELRPTFISIVDNTGTGIDVVEKLNRHKVNTKYMLRNDDGMGTWLAVFDNDGDVCASISKRPDLTPIMSVLEEHGDEIFSNADSVIVEFDMPREMIKQILGFAKKYNKPVYAVISNMSIAVKLRDLMKETACFVCNLQEAGIFFSENYEKLSPKKMAAVLADRIALAQIPKMVVTMGGDGAVYADINGDYGVCPPNQVNVKDTTGAGDAFFSGVAAGLTYGKTLAEACEIGSRLASAVICTMENVCPRYLPGEFGLPIIEEEQA